MKLGDRRRFFDPDGEWRVTGDVGDNDIYWRPATVVFVDSIGDQEVANIVWDHRPDHISHSHYTDGAKPVLEAKLQKYRIKYSGLVGGEEEVECDYVTTPSADDVLIKFYKGTGTSRQMVFAVNPANIKSLELIEGVQDLRSVDPLSREAFVHES